MNKEDREKLLVVGIAYLIAAVIMGLTLIYMGVFG